jgi:CubicO group peptidase (beta-lactamase class C family)
MKIASLCALIIVIAALVIVSGTAPAARPEDVGLSADRLQRITQMIQRRIDAGELAGAVTIVARRGRVAHHAAQGVTDLQSKQPMTPGAMFRIASMTKPIIGASIMLLVEEGRLRLNDPVARFIPEFRAMKVAVPHAGTNGDSRFSATPAEREITIKDLLTHVSGLGSGPLGLGEIDKVARKEGERLADYIPRLGRTPLEFQPGSRWAYSPGAGFETLGRVIEIASGMPLDRFFRTRIFDPLGMRDITFWPSDAQWPRVATVYTRGPQGLTKAVMPNDTMSRNVYFRGSGGLYSTAEDYIPFGIMMANGGEMNGTRLLSRKSVEMMTAVHVPDTLPGRPAGEGFGLSVRVVTNHARRTTMLSDGTYGWSGAQGTHFVVDPREQLVGVLMVQTPNNAEVRSEFEDLMAQAIVD